MERTGLHPDFKDFLKLLNSRRVEYLLVGGYAVGIHGYPRATADMDVWVAVGKVNAGKLSAVLRDFGMPEAAVRDELFLEENKIIRMGVPPVRIEIITGASGVDFASCYSRREVHQIDDLRVSVIGLEDLKTNKRASARHKDLEDIEHLP